MFCGLKEVGSDQDSVAYARYFTLDNYSLSQVAEPTFSYIAEISRWISNKNGLIILFFIYATLGVSIKLAAIKKLSPFVWLSLITYFSTFFLLHEFTQIRAGIASGLLLLSISFIYKRQLYLFLLTIAVASLFHYSALAAFPLYFLTTRTLTNTNKVIIGSAVPLGITFTYFSLDIVNIIPIELVQTKIDVYKEVEKLNQIKLNAYNAVYLVKYAMLYLFLFFSDKISKKNDLFPIFLNIYAISLFSYLALSFNAAFAIRISELFGIVEIVMIPMLYYVVKPKELAAIAVVILAGCNLALGLYQTELIAITR